MCQLTKEEDFICLPSDFTDYEVGDEVIVMLLDADGCCPNPWTPSQDDLAQSACNAWARKEWGRGAAADAIFIIVPPELDPFSYPEICIERGVISELIPDTNRADVALSSGTERAIFQYYCAKIEGLFGDIYPGWSGFYVGAEVLTMRRKDSSGGSDLHVFGWSDGLPRVCGRFEWQMVDCNGQAGAVIAGFNVYAAVFTDGYQYDPGPILSNVAAPIVYNDEDFDAIAPIIETYNNVDYYVLPVSFFQDNGFSNQEQYWTFFKYPEDATLCGTTIHQYKHICYGPDWFGVIDLQTPGTYSDCYCCCFVFHIYEGATEITELPLDNIRIYGSDGTLLETHFQYSYDETLGGLVFVRGIPTQTGDGGCIDPGGYCFHFKIRYTWYKYPGVCNPDEVCDAASRILPGEYTLTVPDYTYQIQVNNHPDFGSGPMDFVFLDVFSADRSTLIASNRSENVGGGGPGLVPITYVDGFFTFQAPGYLFCDSGAPCNGVFVFYEAAGYQKTQYNHRCCESEWWNTADCIGPGVYVDYICGTLTCADIVLPFDQEECDYLQANGQLAIKFKAHEDAQCYRDQMLVLAQSYLGVDNVMVSGGYPEWVVSYRAPGTLCDIPPGFTEPSCPAICEHTINCCVNQVACSTGDGDATIDVPGSVTAVARGGVGPFTWSVSGGFSISVLPAPDDWYATVTGGIEAAGSVAVVTVTDGCGDSSTCYYNAPDFSCADFDYQATLDYANGNTNIGPSSLYLLFKPEFLRVYYPPEVLSFLDDGRSGGCKGGFSYVRTEAGMVIIKYQPSEAVCNEECKAQGDVIICGSVWYCADCCPDNGSDIVGYPERLSCGQEASILTDLKTVAPDGDTVCGQPCRFRMIAELGTIGRANPESNVWYYGAPGGDPCCPKTDTIELQVIDNAGDATSVASVTIDIGLDDVMSWGENNPTVMNRESSTGIYVSGNKGEVTWSVSGVGFTLAATQTDGSNVLTSSGDSCGSATITATDGCGNSASGVVDSIFGRWVYQPDDKSCHNPGPYTQPPWLTNWWPRVTPGVFTHDHIFRRAISGTISIKADSSPDCSTIASLAGCSTCLGAAGLPRCVERNSSGVCPEGQDPSSAYQSLPPSCCFFCSFIVTKYNPNLGYDESWFSFISECDYPGDRQVFLWGC